MTQILSKTFSSMIKIKSFLWKTVLDWCEKQLILLSVYSTTFFSRLNISILCHFLRSSDKLQKNLSSTLYIKICVPYSSATSSMTEVTLIMHFVCQSSFMTRKKKQFAEQNIYDRYHHTIDKDFCHISFPIFLLKFPNVHQSFSTIMFLKKYSFEELKERKVFKDFSFTIYINIFEII